MTNVFALLRLLPMSSRDKDAEILALRDQITVLERQLVGERVRFFPSDRFLAALLHRLPSRVLRRIRLVVRPDTVLRRHRDLIARRHAARSRPERPGRPRDCALGPAALDARLPERTALLAEQLRSTDPATRYDAIDLARSVIVSWGGDHTRLVRLLADCLLPHDSYTAAAAAEALGSLAGVADPAREALASYVAAHRTAYGPDVWANPPPCLRRAHQEAVLALAHVVRRSAIAPTQMDRDVSEGTSACGEARPRSVTISAKTTTG